jgi:hypothetical protein
VVAVVKDLFFVARIRETARLTEVPLVFARTPDEVRAALVEPTRFVLIDLTGALDHEGFFGAIEAAAPRPPVLAFTTHVLAGTTRPWHARCDRVVTKETLTQELASLLKEGLAA